MTQHHRARRRPVRSGAVVLTTCLALLAGIVPASIAFTSEVPADATTETALETTGTAAGTTTDAFAASSATSRTGADGPAASAFTRQDAGTADPVAVGLESVSPTVARPGDTVKVALRITNTTDAPLTGLTARLAVNADALTQRSALPAWESLSLTDRVAGAGPAPKKIGKLAPGKSRIVRLTFPTATYTLQGWGPREMSVEFGNASGRLGVERTFLLYDDGGAPTTDDAMRLTIAAPVTAGAVDPDDLQGAQLQLAQEAADQGRLDQMLQVAESGKISLAVDPNVIGLARSASDEDLQEWGTSFLAATQETSTYALPAWDPDIAALAHADVPRGRTRGILNTPVVDEWQPPSSWGTGLAWPARGVADRVTVAAATYAERPYVILGNGTLAPTSDAAAARADVPLNDGIARTAVADDVLSAAFSQGTDIAPALSATAPATDDGATSPTTPAPSRTGAAAAQRLLAETAAILAQAPSARPHALITADRTWYPDGDAVDTIVKALADASWVKVAPLKALLESRATGTTRTPLPHEAPGDRELSAEEVDRIDTSRTRSIDFSSLATDAAELRRNSLSHLVAPLAIGYRRDPDQRQLAVDNGLAYAKEIREAVRLIPREGVNLISDRGDLPIRVSNELDTDVEVTVVLRPDSPRLTVARSVTDTVPAGREMDLAIPVEAIGSGDVAVRAELLAPSGVQVGAPTSFEVRVRAGWEEVGTWIVAGLVGLLFIVGIWRTVRRGRSPNRATVEDVAAATGELAVTPPSSGTEPPAGSGTTTDARPQND